MNKLIITALRGRKAAVLMSESRAVQIEFAPKEELLQPGTILIGRVRNVVKNLNAAFVECSPGVNGYYSLSENREHLFADGRRGGSLRAGDMLIVQVERAATKSKDAALTADLNMAGQYVVVTARRGQFGISSKIRDQKWREEFAARWESEAKTPDGSGFGAIIRTNARSVPFETVLEEALGLAAQLERLLSVAACRVLFSVLKRPESFFLRMARDAYRPELAEIVTDLPEVCAELTENGVPVRFYDDSYPLSSLYHLETSLSRALDKTVWLRSGGTLVIEPTEAMTVIDVNTGKSVENIPPAEHYFRTNLEAAEEIACQLRLRNLSGIIIVDFIDMKDEEHREELMRCFKRCLSADPVRTVLVDMTPLGLVEVTRKKIRRPLHEQVLNV